MKITRDIASYFAAQVQDRILPNMSGDGDAQGGKFEYLRL
jgi:hypothetical protein